MVAQGLAQVLGSILGSALGSVFLHTSRYGTIHSVVEVVGWRWCNSVQGGCAIHSVVVFDVDEGGVGGGGGGGG
jgi:hypothetical protein